MDECFQKFKQLVSRTPMNASGWMNRTLKLSKILLKIGMVVHVTLGYVRVELN